MIQKKQERWVEYTQIHLREGEEKQGGGKENHLLLRGEAAVLLPLSTMRSVVSMMRSVVSLMLVSVRAAPSVVLRCWW